MIRAVCPLAVAIVAGCALAPDADRAAMVALNRAHDTLQQIENNQAVASDPRTFEDARLRYNLALQMSERDSGLARQLAEEAQVLGELVLSKAEAARAATQLAAAQAEMAEVQRLSAPETVAPRKRSKRRR